jgi:hypothetical protein
MVEKRDWGWGGVCEGDFGGECDTAKGEMKALLEKRMERVRCMDVE